MSQPRSLTEIPCSSSAPPLIYNEAPLPMSGIARPAGIRSTAPSQGIFPDASSKRQSSTGSVTPRVDPKPFATESSLQVRLWASKN